jgi:hypothetical protein
MGYFENSSTENKNEDLSSLKLPDLSQLAVVNPPIV